MQNLKVGDYIHVVKRSLRPQEAFYATVKEIINDENTGQFLIAVVIPDGGKTQRLVFARNKITLVNLIEANE